MNAGPLQPVLSRRGFIFGISALAGGLVLGTPAVFAQAGAQARMMLIAEAAARWNCPAEECSASNSVVTHGASGRTLRYGALAEAASARPVPENVSLKRPQDWRLIGSSPRSFDIQVKIT